MQTANGILEIIFGAGVAVFPSIGFMYQYRLINARKSIGTFSINVCGVMFLSNFLKIAFFIYKEFSLALLLQAVLNILMQVLLLYLCVKTMNLQGYFEKELSKVKDKRQSCMRDFWRWRDISKYFLFLGMQAFLIFFVGYVTRVFSFQNAGQILGYASLTVETFLLLPQLMQNLKQKQVVGISYVFVALNTFQDMLELIFVLIYSQPLQFVIFNFLQVLTNVLLILQILFYKKCCNKSVEDCLRNVQENHVQQDLQVLTGQHITRQIVKESTQSRQSQEAKSCHQIQQFQNQSTKSTSGLVYQ